MQYSIVPMEEKHKPGVVAVFNYYIQNSFAAFPSRPLPEQMLDKFVDIAKAYPAVSVLDETGKVVGFAMLRPYYFEDSMKRTGEISYFLMPEATGQGIGSMILKQFIERAKLMGIDNILACISSRNIESINFHKKHGFEQVGLFKRVGRKFDRDFDIVWMQKMI
ncbi:MAG: N-acetyltransferase [candidate division Zixibacteria bacterium]|nr:N-acetyltransferase [candidate division Zixibacteria bacterium]